MARYKVRVGDCIESMRTLPDQMVHTCVTSPPYFGLRDYGEDGQIGAEETPDEYVQRLVEVFREIRRVLRDDGTVWLNLGDSYNSANTGGFRAGSGRADGVVDKRGQRNRNGTSAPDCKPKDLIGIPWRVAFALQADGWYLRQDIIWHKPNPMPESVRDRCTKAHEYVFLLSKGPKYYYDHEASKEPATTKGRDSAKKGTFKGKTEAMAATGQNSFRSVTEYRNRRSVWSVTARPYKGAHFATFPPDLIEPCILAGCPEGGVVIDPFAGSGTTAGVAVAHGRNALLCELSADYTKLIPERVDQIKEYYVKRGD